MKTIIFIVAGLAALAGPTLQAQTNWEAVDSSRLEIKNADLQDPGDDTPSIVPLRHTDVQFQVRGFVAEATVTQQFENVLDQPIEAEYVFPLPHDAAVNATEMRIGDRVIRGRIDRRETARRAYDDAKAAGQRTSLLEQERPNIFTQSVANIGPGETIEIVIKYVQPLPYADGAYELVFPMVVGPRYIPGRPVDQDSAMGPAGRGREPDTDQVPDASRITPPALKPGQRCRFDIDIQVDIDTGVPLREVRSRAHSVTMRRTGESTASVTLADEDRIPNKDFVLEIAVAGDQPEVGLLAHHDGKNGYFMLVLQPPDDSEDQQIRPREVIIVLDCSGSMTGQPIALAKRAAEAVLLSLRPEDTFNIVSFSVEADFFQPTAAPAHERNVQAGIRHIRSLAAEGGTEMMTGVRAALTPPLQEGYLRIITLFTDGYIGNDTQIIAAVQKMLGPARVFSFGVGSSVNRYLLDRMALVGRGTAQYILLGDSPEKTIQTFAVRLSKPILTDISLNFGDLAVRALAPSPIPDVYEGSPIYVYGRYDQPAEGTVEIVGRVGAKPSLAKIQISLPGPSEGSSPLPSMWARDRIKELELNKLAALDPAPIVSDITQLALDYALMSAYTSFVAIDETPSPSAGGQPRYVPVSVPMPAGVEYEATINDAASPSPFSGYGSGGSRGHAGGGSGGDSGGRSGGGPIGPFGLAVVAVMAVAEWRRRKCGR